MIDTYKITLLSTNSYLIDAQFAKAIDLWTSKELGIPSFTLMECAGKAAAEQFILDFPEAKRIAILLGKGNNAGDALVMARYLMLLNRNIECSFIHALGQEMATEDARKNHEILFQLSGDSLKNRLDEIDASDSNLIEQLYSFDCIIDALFGVGLDRPIESSLAKIVEQINKLTTPILALDVPSGLDATNGNRLGCAIQADFTYTFGFDKLGLHLSDGPKLGGTIRILPLAFDIDAFHEQHNEFAYSKKIESHDCFTSSNIKTEIKHKYDGSAVLILGSSEGMTGATIAVSEAAWAAGASAVFLIAPKKLAPIFEQALPQVVKWFVGKESDSYLMEAHADQIFEKLHYFDNKGILVCGPALGIQDDTKRLFDLLFSKIDQPTLFDADAIRFLEEAHLNHKSNELILTPHLGEWNNLCERWSLAESFTQHGLQSYLDIAQWVKEKGIHLIKKGNPTCYINTLGELHFCITSKTQPFNRTGFGDILCGQLSATIGRYKQIEAAVKQSLSIGLLVAEKTRSNLEPQDIISHLKQVE